jgi:putative ABC transport system substrate-binding protein
VSAFSQRLRELGWIEGQNLVVEVRWTEGRTDQLSRLMAEVIKLKIDVLLTASTPYAVAAKRATSTVPIVVALMGDPITTGLANSLARPGSNLTGLSTGFGEGFAGKWLEILKETMPALSTVAVVFNPDSSLAKTLRQQLEGIASTRGVKLKFIEIPRPSSLQDVFREASLAAQAVIVLPDPLTYYHRGAITALASKYRLPSIYPNLEFVDAGGLMAYGVDFVALFRRAAEYVDKILRGAKAAELPIEQPTHYMFVINLKAAKSLGITIPESILLRADEVLR